MIKRPLVPPFYHSRLCDTIVVMKIIALSASPSRGRNSDTMLDHFIIGLKTVPNIEVEKIYLTDIPVDIYNFQNGTGPQTHETAFAELTKKLKSEAVGLIIATPTYNFSVPAGLKNFIDRIRFIAMDLTRRNTFGQPVGMLGHLRTYFLVSGGTPSWAQKILFFGFPPFWLRAVFLYFGAEVMGAYYSGDIKTFDNKKVLAKCEAKGKRYGEQVIRGQRQGWLERLFWRPPQLDK